MGLLQDMQSLISKKIIVDNELALSLKYHIKLIKETIDLSIEKDIYHSAFCGFYVGYHYCFIEELTDLFLGRPSVMSAALGKSNFIIYVYNDVLNELKRVFADDKSCTRRDDAIIFDRVVFKIHE